MEPLGWVLIGLFAVSAAAVILMVIVLVAQGDDRANRRRRRAFQEFVRTTVRNAIRSSNLTTRP